MSRPQIIATERHQLHITVSQRAWNYLNRIGDGRSVETEAEILLESRAASRLAGKSAEELDMLLVYLEARDRIFRIIGWALIVVALLLCFALGTVAGPVVHLTTESAGNEKEAKLWANR